MVEQRWGWRVRHNRHAHHQSFESSGSACVREGVDTDIDVVVHTQMPCRGWDEGHQVHLRCGYPCPRQTHLHAAPHSGASERLGFEQEPGTGDERQNSSPSPNNAVVHLGQPVEAAERHNSTSTHRGLAWKRRESVCWGVTQEGPRQPHQALGELLVSALGVSDVVCQPVLHSGQTSRVGVPDPSHLDRGGLQGKEVQPVACGVP
mmetsp:Transcript_34080/g.67164  ORF Transcript_34080/g.67164 Transcript_34080/m.67164 type:complete len:205 (-) Transcript_34080:399-1013(-)